MPRISFRASLSPEAQSALSRLTQLYGDYPVEEADFVVAIGGDGFMLETLHAVEGSQIAVYGMNKGTVGFLMNSFDEESLPQRLENAQETTINPLRMVAEDLDGEAHQALAINEVSLLRAGPQAAWLRILINGKERLGELVCDGALVATPAGSTAYNYSAHGPILPIESDVLALTAMSAYRPRRWRGALVPKSSTVRFEVLDPAKRPVMAEADSRSVRNIRAVDVISEPAIRHKLLFDPGHELEERLIQEQFV